MAGKIIWADPPARRPGRPRLTDKPSSTDRGYGAAHKRERARWAPLVQTGTLRCVRCVELISPTEVWHLDHAEVPNAKELGIYNGPTHAVCNSGKRKPKPQQTPPNKPPPAVVEFFGLEAK